VSRPEQNVLDKIAGQIPMPECERMAASAERLAGILGATERPPGWASDEEDALNVETSEAVRRWAALPESLRHAKNLAMLAVEHLVLPDDHPCRVVVVQDADYWNPRVSVLVELAGGAERTVEILGGDDPVALATRIRATADDLLVGEDC